MRIFITSTPEELEPHQAAACDVVRELRLEPVLRDVAGVHGLDPVRACARQVERTDLVLAIVGHRRGRVPPPELGGDGRHPWTWWETRAGFEHGKPVLPLLAADASAASHEDDPRASAVLRDFRGELARLAVPFDAADVDGFRALVRRQLEASQQASDNSSLAALERKHSSVVEPTLRRWPPPALPERPYPVLLPYTHPDLMAGRDHELDELRRLLARPVAITGLHAASGTGKSSLLAGGLVPVLRGERRPVAFERHPCEAGIVGRLLGELVEDENAVEDDDARAFVDALNAVRRAAEGVPPVLVLDQFEGLFRDLPGARRARTVIGTLLASSAQRLPGLDGPPCRWLLAYRQEFHSDVVRWLRDVLREARKSPQPPFLKGEQESESPPLGKGGLGGFSFPHDLSGPDRFQSYALPPLGTPTPGTDDPTTASSRIFEAAITQPLTLTRDDGSRRYPWRFAADGAARLARAFAEARMKRRKAPLAPELQVVLAHLLERAGRPRDAEVSVQVRDDPGELIEAALEEHLRRSLDVAFLGGRDTRLGRARALLALRELADAHGRRDAGRPVAALAQAIGSEGHEVLEKLATARTRLVLLEEHGGEQVYVLSHDRMAEVLVRLFDEGTFAGLGVDAELLGLRRIVALHSELFASGEVDEATRIALADTRRIEKHAEALLWGEERQRWWAACRSARRRSRQRKVVRWGIAAAVVVAVSLGAWKWAERRTTYKGWIQEVETARDPEATLTTLVRLLSMVDAIPAVITGLDEADLLAALRQRQESSEVPMDVLEHGLGTFEGEERSVAVLRLVELALPWVEETPEDPELIANLVWALDYGPGRDPAFAMQAVELRNRVLKPIRELRTPPSIRADDPDWIEVPAGTFLMGSPEGEGDDNEQPQHRVRVSAFRILRHEVTNADFRRLVPDHPIRAIEETEQDERRSLYENHFTADDLPAFVSWYQAWTYSAWLGGRLPTEAEWEYTARAGCPHAYCNRHGKEVAVEDVGWIEKNSPDVPFQDKTTDIPSPVMKLEPNPWGIYDVLGNFWEWNADWYAGYPAEPTSAYTRSDPWGPAAPSGVRRVIRGGGFRSDAWWARVAFRSRHSPDFGSDLLGFRVALPSGRRSSRPYPQMENH